MGRPSVMPGDPEPRRKLKRFQMMDDGWGIPAYDENEEQDDVNPAVSEYEDFMRREGHLWGGKSFAEAEAMTAAWEEQDIVELEP